nr:putative phage abortive infection protein [Shewanella sp. YLB-07]
MKYAGLLVASALPLVVYICVFNEGFSQSSSDWADFGSYVGGVYGALGFIAVVFTLYINGKQSMKSEQDQVFYKSMDLFASRTNNFEVESDLTLYKGVKAVKIIVEDMQQELKKQCIKNARHLLCLRPSEISPTHYLKIIEAYCNDNYDKDLYDFVLKGVHTALSDDKTYEERWEQIKFYIQSSGHESDLMQNALFALGSVWFYKVSFEDRQSMFHSVIQEINHSHGNFIDGYVKNLEFISAFINQAENKELYVKFIKSQLSNYEMVVIYHYAMGSDNSDIYKTIVALGLAEVTTAETRALLVDFPSTDEIKSDFDNLKES